ncbi:hypothetical protein NL676_009115 [Syzygium grande]|nr:hypothetical protein NL676_009115 [Syzygium grande]
MASPQPHSALAMVAIGYPAPHPLPRDIIVPTRLSSTPPFAICGRSAECTLVGGDGSWEVMEVACGQRWTSLVVGVVGVGRWASSEALALGARVEAEARALLVRGGVGIGVRRQTLLVGGSGPRSSEVTDVACGQRRTSLVGGVT